ncbi:MAG: hypothetical protein R3178_08850, partial [Rhodothermales bacterium]|nr:hypothetical protein [Rhodothermales bacterium]
MSENRSPVRTIKAVAYVVSALLAALLCASCGRTGAPDPASMYESREPSDSLGTGRIYLGREIPHVREHAEVA